MTRISINQTLQSDLSRLQLTLVTVIHDNTHRNRCSLIVKNTQNKKYFMKWIHPSAQANHFTNLNNESTFLSSNSRLDFLPCVVHSERNILLLDFIESKSLRDWLIDYRRVIKNKETVSDDFINFVKILINNLGLFYFNSNKAVEKSEISEYFLVLWSKLLRSGPMKTKRGSIEQQLSIVLYKIFSRRVKRHVKRLIVKSDNLGLYNKTTHGDLHLTNIIVSSNPRNIYIVDWEVVQKNGSWVNDIAFLYSNLFALLNGLPFHQQYLYDSFRKMVQNQNPQNITLFNAFTRLFCHAALTNRNFLYKIRFFDLLSNYIKFLFFSIKCLI